MASLLDVSRVNLDVLNKVDRLEKLQAEYTAHTRRVTELREQQRQTQAFNQLCADVNKLAGTDSANFFTKAGKVFENEQEPQMNEMIQEQQSKQQTFDETTQAYVSKYAMENSDKEENALKLDVSNTPDILPDP